MATDPQISYEGRAHRRTIDARAICNMMLDVAQEANITVSNLALQKLLYFAHARHLIETKRPLVTGYFEAWQYGPDHPAAYNAFKVTGDSPSPSGPHAATL